MEPRNGIAFREAVELLLVCQACLGLGRVPGLQGSSRSTCLTTRPPLGPWTMYTKLMFPSPTSFTDHSFGSPPSLSASSLCACKYAATVDSSRALNPGGTDSAIFSEDRQKSSSPQEAGKERMCCQHTYVLVS